MASAPLLGSKISLISKSEIRYEGILYAFDTKESTVALAEVKSFGTEDRPTERPVAPKDEVYEYIIFRANQIKDLHVCEAPAQYNLHCDPAIVTVKHSQPLSQSSLPNYSQHFSCGIPSFPHVPSQSSYAIPHVLSSSHYSGAGISRSIAQTSKKSPTSDAGVQVSVRSADQDRNDIREPLRPRNRELGQPNMQNRRFVQTQSRQLGRRSVSRRGRRNSVSIERFENEYDFEQANAEFKELENKFIKNSIDDSKTESPSIANLENKSETYNKANSFFDDISCESSERSKGSPRFDWRYEQKLNVETFGVSANNNWLRRRRARGGYRRGYRGRGGFGRQNVEVPAPKTVTFDETPVIKEVEMVMLEDKPSPIPVIEVIAAEPEKKDWPEGEIKPEVWP